jgi:hypothetical protein
MADIPDSSANRDHHFCLDFGTRFKQCYLTKRFIPERSELEGVAEMLTTPFRHLKGQNPQ